MFYRPHNRVYAPTGGPTLTQQHFKEHCDINNILSGYAKTGMLEHAKTYEGRYGDFTASTDYHEAMQQIVTAQAMFDTLPAKIRKKFGNDPAEFLEFAQNPSNEAEMASMGLLPEPYPERTQALSELTGGDSKASPKDKPLESPSPATPE